MLSREREKDRRYPQATITSDTGILQLERNLQPLRDLQSVVQELRHLAVNRGNNSTATAALVCWEAISAGKTLSRLGDLLGSVAMLGQVEDDRLNK